MTSTIKEVHLRGFPICSGIAIGKPFCFTILDLVSTEFTIASGEVEDEVNRYKSAIACSLRDIGRIKQQLESEGVCEGAAILEAHVQILQDPLITTEVEQLIRVRKKNSESVFQEVIQGYQEKFESLGDAFFAERFKDVQDIARRILGYLRKSIRISLADIPKNSIVFSQDLAPSDTAEVSDNVIAFVTERGGETSHAAIMARARGIPYISNVDFHVFDKLKESIVIVDGGGGKVILNPSKETLSKYKLLQKQQREHFKEIEKISAFDTETIDGYSVCLSANIETEQELPLLHKYRGQGVGLFRSEYLFFSQRNRFPSEEEQYIVYSRILKGLNGLPIVIRTFDIGGDKLNELTQETEENNPFLGCRAIRFMLKKQDIFKDQLRALLRASLLGDVHILFPMISTVTEFLQAKALVNEVRKELLVRGISVGDDVKLGCMVEVPSAVICADALAKECAFLAIGTNDLVQYTLAVDRGNQNMSYLYNPMHPSIIRMIKMVVNEAQVHGIPVSVCGEIAADPRFTPLLIGLGIHELSMAPRYIPNIRKAIRSLSIVDACTLAETALSLSTAEEVHQLLTEEYERLASDEVLRL